MSKRLFQNSILILSIVVLFSTAGMAATYDEIGTISVASVTANTYNNTFIVDQFNVGSATLNSVTIKFEVGLDSQSFSVKNNPGQTRNLTLTTTPTILLQAVQMAQLLSQEVIVAQKLIIVYLLMARQAFHFH